MKTENKKVEDYLSLKEVLTRRFKLWEIKEEDKELIRNKDERYFLHIPNVFILDWGKGQLWIIKELLEEYPHFEYLLNCVQFCALWKWEARKKASIWKQSKKWNDKTIWEKLYVWKNNEIIEHDLVYDEADRILVKLRDEAHRFSNAYRKKQEQLAFKKPRKRLRRKNDNK